MEKKEPIVLTIILGDGPTEASYYSDQQVRVIIVDPCILEGNLEEAVWESTVLPLESARLPERIKSEVRKQSA